MLSKHSNCAMYLVLKLILPRHSDLPSDLPRHSDAGLQSQPVGDEAGGSGVQGPSGLHKTLSHKTNQHQNLKACKLTIKDGQKTKLKL